MKTILKKLISSLLLIVLITGVSAQKKEERKAKKQQKYKECIQLIESGAFKFEAERAYPQGWVSVDLTTNYGFLKISENKSECDLPFFGRAYRMEYGGDGGMNFKGDIFNEKWTRNDKKNKFTFSFDVKDKESFTVILEAFSKESCSLIILSDSKAHISYSGQIIELEKEDPDNQ